MFEQLFGSKTRVKLIKVFLDNPNEKYYVRELTRLTDTLINSIRRELVNLVEMKIVVCEEKGSNKDETKKGLNTKKFYSLNQKNLFLQELTSLFSKGKLLLEKKLIERIKRLGDIKYLAFGGIFVDDERGSTDIIIVGDLDKNKAVASLNKFEKELGKDVRFTIMTVSEFQLRNDIADNFLDEVMTADKNIVLIDKLTKKKVISSDQTEVLS